MKMILASIFTTILIVAMSLGAMFILVQTSIYVGTIGATAPRMAAIAAELVLGVILLLGTVWLATHLAVRIFRKTAVGTEETAAAGGPIG